MSTASDIPSARTKRRRLFRLVGPFRIVQTDGNPVPPAAQIDKDTVNIGPGERYDVIWEARRPGKRLLHCRIPHHTTNDHAKQDGAGGMTLVIEVRP